MSIEEKILAAAEEEFYLSGFDASSTAKIAKRVGVTHAMVNYYYRTKEQLFLRILDGHVDKALSALRQVMREHREVEETLRRTAVVLFGLFDEDRSFPFLLLDASRSHPEYLSRYRDRILESDRNILDAHAKRLEASLPDGDVAGMFETVLSLSYTPFLHIPFLRNVVGYSGEQVDDYLRRRKEEIVTLLANRYSNTK